MKDYVNRPSIEFVVHDLLKGLTINKDYIIAGGFIRDEAFGLNPKDIDVFVREGATETELDWELLTQGRSDLVFCENKGSDSDYIDPRTQAGGLRYMAGLNMADVHTDWIEARIPPPDPEIDQFHNNPAAEIRLEGAPLATLYGGRRSAQVKVTEIEEDSIQKDRQIARVEESVYSGQRFAINFIHCTVTKGFTPENLVDTFDYDLVQGYVADDLSLVLPKNYAKAIASKTVTLYNNTSERAFNKSLRRVSNWLCRAGYKDWKLSTVERNQSFFDKIKSPYKDFINRNGRPTKHEKFPASPMSVW